LEVKYYLLGIFKKTLTPRRAVSVNANVRQGQNVLITGIGGGVALIVLQLCIAKGASVYVTSSSPEKIQKAMALGAKGGANYKDSKCRINRYYHIVSY